MVRYLPVESVKEVAVLDCLDPVILSRTYCKNHTGRGHKFSCRQGLNPVSLSTGLPPTLITGGRMHMWVILSAGGQGALGPVSGAAERVPDRVTDRTLPRENTARLPSP